MRNICERCGRDETEHDKSLCKNCFSEDEEREELLTDEDEAMLGEDVYEPDAEELFR